MSEALYFFAGAAVGFAGPWLLQQARFRRQDLDGVRERLGVARALIAELQEARVQIEGGIKRGTIPRTTHFTVVVWQTHAHRLIAALSPPGWTRIVDAFAALSGSNAHLAGIPPEKTVLTVTPGTEFGDAFGELQRKVHAAFETLRDVHREYEVMEAELRSGSGWRPWRKRKSAPGTPPPPG